MKNKMIKKTMNNLVKLVAIFAILLSIGCQKTENKSNTLLKNPTPEKMEVLNAIVKFHDGMRQKNGEMAISVWENTAAGYSISIDSLGNVKKSIENPVDLESLERMRKWLNKTKDNLDEEIFDAEVRIDGQLAMAWVPYNFYTNTKFSHSGTNAFTLMKFGSQWKIVSVADTRYFGQKIHE